MTKALFTTLAATVFGAAFALAGSVTDSHAQNQLPNNTAALLKTAQYAQQAAPHHRAVHHRRVARRTIIENEPITTGSIGAPPMTAPYPRSEVWPPCLQGPPFCTAAGYPNLGYLRRMEGAPF